MDCQVALNGQASRVTRPKRGIAANPGAAEDCIVTVMEITTNNQNCFSAAIVRVGTYLVADCQRGFLPTCTIERSANGDSAFNVGLVDA